jgi:tetratricopeptide (TPR) repeat protein
MSKTLFSILLHFLILGSQTDLFGQESQNLYEKGIEQLKQTHITGNEGYKNALTFFTQSVELDSTNISARFWKSQCEIKLGKTDEALKTSNSTLELLKEKRHSLEPKFHVTSGIIEKLNGDDNKAHVHFTQAISNYKEQLNNDNNNYDAIMNISIILCYDGQKTKAIEFLESMTENERNTDLLKESKIYVENFDMENELNKIKNER